MYIIYNTIKMYCCIGSDSLKSINRDKPAHLCQLFYAVRHTLGDFDVGKCMTGGSSTRWQKDENGMASLATHTEDLVETFVGKFIRVRLEGLVHEGRNGHTQSIWSQQAKDDQVLKASPWTSI